jgi:phage FluMu protein Com
MQIRCYHCHKPFALGKETIHAALDEITTQGLSHYDAHCPHCRRANRVSRPELIRAAPEWRKQAAEEEATEEKAADG